MENLSKFVRVKKELTKEEFLRQVFISLSKDEKTPSNIMDAKFGEITEYNIEVLVCTCNVKVNYSGSVGYDREEEYWDKEKKWDKSGNAYYAPVKKTRTVTDWQPHQGTLEVEKTDCVINGSDDDEKLIRIFPEVINKCKDDSFVDDEERAVYQASLQKCISFCKLKAELSVNWPGDHKKDDRYNDSANVTSMECFIVPCYEIEFNYGGKTYRARGMAIGAPNEVHEAPESGANVESMETINRRRNMAIYIAEKPKKTCAIMRVLATITGIISFTCLFMYFFGVEGKSIITILFACCLIAATIILGTINSIKSKKIEKEVARINLRAKVEEKNLKNQKVEKLISVLKQRGLAPLSDSEKKGISNKDDYK